MKSVKYLLAIFFAAIVMASCTTTQRTIDDEFDGATTRRIGNRVYVDDPYAGTVILERDPVTGRYRDVTYGRTYGYYNYPYNRLNTRVYRGGYNRGYGNYNHGNVQRPTQPSQGNRSEARKRVLGN
jgi:hypothetical protein